MSISPSTEALWNCPREENYVFASLFRRTYKTSEIHKRHTFEASEAHDIEDDNMSVTRSISIAQTDYRVLKANSIMICTFTSCTICTTRTSWNDPLPHSSTGLYVSIMICNFTCWTTRTSWLRPFHITPLKFKVSIMRYSFTSCTTRTS